jgi:hypothetical protein
MFHAISAWLARRWRQILEIGLERDNLLAVAHGRHARQIKPGTWSYRDPRFIHRMFNRICGSTGCPWCDSKIAEWLDDSGYFDRGTQAVSAGRWF